MKRWLILIPILASATGAYAEMGKSGPSPYILLRTTSPWTAGQYFGWIVVSSCTGCGSGSSGSSDNLGSHVATAPLQMNGFFIQNTSGVVIGASTPTGNALLTISSQGAIGSTRYITISSGTEIPVYEFQNSSFSIRGSTGYVSYLNIVSSVNYGFPLTVGQAQRDLGTSLLMNTYASTVLLFAAQFGPVRIIARDYSNGALLQVGAGLGAIFGSLNSVNATIRTGDTDRMVFDTSGNANLVTAGAKLAVGAAAASSVLDVVAGSITVRGTRAGLRVGTTNFIVFADAGTTIGTGSFNSSMLDIWSGSVSVHPGEGGRGGGISASTYTVNGASLFGSTWTTFGMDASVIRVTTGTIIGNTSITMTAANLSLSAILWALCTEQEVTNTAGVSVRLKGFTALPTSFDVYNADLTQTKGFTCLAVGRP